MFFRPTGAYGALVAALLLSACASSLNLVAPQRQILPAETVDNRSIIASAVTNLVLNGSFERPLAPTGGYTLFSTGMTFSHWRVVGASGNVAIVSGTFAQNGFSFPAGCGSQWLDLTGTSQTATGVAQTIATVTGTHHTLTFSVGNVYNPNGIFGTTSTVKVYVNGVHIFTAKNSKGSGVMKQVWESFSTSVTAPSTSTTIKFINGDPTTDTNNGLDCVKLT